MLIYEVSVAACEIELMCLFTFFSDTLRNTVLLCLKEVQSLKIPSGEGLQISPNFLQKKVFCIVLVADKFSSGCF